MPVKRWRSPKRSESGMTLIELMIAAVVLLVGMLSVIGLLALAIGNILGGLVLAWSAAMGPAAGFPQMYILDPDRHVIEINAAAADPVSPTPAG